jgi:hypothetical protein
MVVLLSVSNATATFWWYPAVFVVGWSCLPASANRKLAKKLPAFFMLLVVFDSQGWTLQIIHSFLGWLYQLSLQLLKIESKYSTCTYLVE